MIHNKIKVGEIGILRYSGQFGNQLFQFHFGLQLATLLGTNFFCVAKNELKLFSDSQRHFPSAKSIFRKYKRFTLCEVEELGVEQFKNEIREIIQRGENVILPPGLLGEYFFESCYVHPKELIRFKDKNFVLQATTKPRVAIHFRGTDFQTWNPKAIMDYQFYLSALEFIDSELEGTNFDVSIFTDDPFNDLILKLLTCKYNPKVVNLGRDLEFKSILGSDYIVASPSTFSIWAAILSNNSKLILSYKWMKDKVEMNDNFFKNLRSHTNQIVNLHAEL